MDLDPVLLSRLQFAWVIGWHILWRQNGGLAEVNRRRLRRT